jgi:hypothetical protein
MAEPDASFGIRDGVTVVAGTGDAATGAAGLDGVGMPDGLDGVDFC